MNTVLRVSSLSVSYGKKRALHDVSFTLEAGQTIGLLGPNGSGKSTCLHAITGVIDGGHGAVEIDGIPAEDERSRLRFGFAPDDLPLIGALTGREYLQFHDRLRGRHDYGRAIDLLSAFDLDRDVDGQIEGYSHGMKRKIQLIGAVMHSPPLVILDEPFRGLDPDAGIVLKQLIAVLVQQGTAVLIATHDMVRAERDCDQLLVIDRGALVAKGSPAEVVRQFGRGRDLEAAFLAATGREDDLLDKRRLVAEAFARP